MTQTPDNSNDYLENPVYLYFQDIVDIPLLSATDEILLGQRIEQTNYLEQIENSLNETCRNTVSILDTTFFILRNLKESTNTINLLIDELDIGDNGTTAQLLYHPTLRKAIDSGISPQLIDRLVCKTNLRTDDLYEELVRISLNSLLLPPWFIQEMASYDLFHATGDISFDNRQKTKIVRHEDDIIHYFGRIKAQGQYARKRFIEANLRLVVSIAKTYPRKTVPLLDMIQEGNIGLVHAVNKYDHRKGNKFSTYATWWIKQAIHRGVADQSRVIRLPVRIVDDIQKFIHTNTLLSQEYEREPTKSEIAQRMNITSEKLKLIIAAMKDPVSLETPTSDNENMHLCDYIADPNIGPEEMVSSFFLQEQIQQVLDSLPEKENHVLKLRFGFANNRDHTLEEIGQQFQMTREAIRQIEKRALNTLRSWPSISILQCYSEV